MNREEYCIAQSVVAAIRIISSMYESDGEEQEIHVGDSRDRIVEFVKKTTTEWQRENASDLLKSLVSQDPVQEPVFERPFSGEIFAEFDTNSLMVMDGEEYDKCVVGIVERYGQPPIVCYDKNKVLLQLESEGMNQEEALEFFEYNQLGAWMGEFTPCFLSKITKS